MKPSFIKSLSFAINGLRLAFSEKHFKVHIVATILVIILGFCFDISELEWYIVLICVGAVLALEMVNTAIEHLVDLVEPNYNSKAGAIKDLAAGAVLVFSVVSAVIGIMIFGKYILALLLVN